MQGRRGRRLGKWLLKLAVVYGIFIVAGLLLGLVPARQLGLTEETFFHIRMLLMLLGPLYLALLAKIILTIREACRGKDTGAAERGRGAAFATTALLLFLNLSSAETAADWAAGQVQGRGLRSLEKSSRYSLKGKRFLNAFFPIGFSLLLLELLTLLVCIVSFAPLSGIVSNIFILLIVLTGLALLMVPLILSFLSGYCGEKVAHQEQLAQEKGRAIQQGTLVLETDPARRKQYLRFPKRLFWLLCPGCLLVGFFALYVTKESAAEPLVAGLRLLFQGVSGVGMISGIPLLCYWANCSGTSKVQRIYLKEGQLLYTGYSGSMEERVEFAFSLTRLEAWQANKRTLCICGQFIKTTKDSEGSKTTRSLRKTLWIPRTFPPEQEGELLAFLQAKLPAQRT